MAIRRSHDLDPDFFGPSGQPRLCPARLYQWRAYMAENRAARAEHQLAQLTLETILDRYPDVRRAISGELAARHAATAYNDSYLALVAAYEQKLGFALRAAVVDDVTGVIVAPPPPQDQPKET